MFFLEKSRQTRANTNPFEGREINPIAIISFDIDFTSIFQLLALTDITGYANSDSESEV